MVYVRRIANEAINRGFHAVLVTMPDCLTHPAYMMVLEDLGAKMETICLQPAASVVRMIQSRNLVLKQLGYFLAIAALFRKLKPSPTNDCVFVPYIDHFDKAVAFLGSPFNGVPFSALCMQYKFHYGVMGARRPPERGDGTKEWTYRRVLETKGLISLYTIDELLYEFTRTRYPNLIAKLTYVGDPVDMVGSLTKDEAREQLGIPKQNFVILVFGLLSWRKGIMELLNTSEQPNFPGEISFLFVGQQFGRTPDLLTGGIAERLRSAGRLVEINRFVSDEEEFAAFRAADAVWVGYKKFYGMSGVLVQAGKMGLPVIASQDGLIGWLVNKYKTGVTVDVMNPVDVAGKINLLYSDAGERSLFGNNGIKQAEQHSSGQFAAAIMDKF